jgi:hypothetical protein
VPLLAYIKVERVFGAKVISDIGGSVIDFDYQCNASFKNQVGFHRDYSINYKIVLQNLEKWLLVETIVIKYSGHDM